MEDERSYFARRAVEERAAADKAGNAKAREAHERLAERYERQAEATEPPQIGAA